MKRFLAIVLLAFVISANAFAQKEECQWTLNTRAWTTNYFASLIYDVATSFVKQFVFDDSVNDSLLFERLIPASDIVFPIGMGKKGFDNTPIFNPYHRAFSNPFKHLGNYGIGLDASFKPSVVGIYAGAYFKSQEVVFKDTKDNLRGFYFQPRAGLVIGSNSHSFEAGVYYDVVTGCGGSVDLHEKDMLKGGFGLDFAFSRTKNKNTTLLQFSMPLHNFFNTDYPGQQGLKRKVGYIMLSRRVVL